MPGKLVVIDGIDGSGKSTQVSLIKDYLTNKGVSFVHYHFPMYGHNMFSEIISKFLRGEFGNADEVDPLFVANIYAMDRYKFLPELKDALEKYDVVLLDRYVFSNIAYQCAKVPQDSVDQLRDWIIEFEFAFLGLPYPDITFMVDVPTDITSKRMAERDTAQNREYLNGAKDVHEQDINFQKRVREIYLDTMKSHYDCVVVDGIMNGEQLSPESIFKLYKSTLENAIN